MRQSGRRLPRRVRVVVGMLAFSVGGVGLAGVSSPADAAIDDIETTVYRTIEAPVPMRTLDGPDPGNEADPVLGCPNVPGLTRTGRVTAVQHLTRQQTSLNFYFQTQYRKATAVAKQAFADLYTTAPTCQNLYAFDGWGEAQTLWFLACVVRPDKGSRPNRWCELAQHGFTPGNAMPASVEMDTEVCREPRWNNGQWGPFASAEWHNAHVHIDKIDLLEEADLNWLPGHLNSNVFVEDFVMLQGVANDADHNGANNEGRWYGYGKAQTALASEFRANWFDSVARALGMSNNYIKTHPVVAHGRVRDAVQANQQVSLGGKLVRLRKAHDDLFTWQCALTPWVSTVLGDTLSSAPYNISFPPINGCSTGFKLWFPRSAQGIGWGLREFVATNNNGRVPSELKEFQRFISLSMIIQEAWSNAGPLQIRDPFSTAPDPPCKVEIDLGSGATAAAARAEHFRRLVTQLGSLLG